MLTDYALNGSCCTLFTKWWATSAVLTSNKNHKNVDLSYRLAICIVGIATSDVFRQSFSCFVSRLIWKVEVKDANCQKIHHRSSYRPLYKPFDLWFIFSVFFKVLGLASTMTNESKKYSTRLRFASACVNWPINFYAGNKSTVLWLSLDGFSLCVCNDFYRS